MKKIVRFSGLAATFIAVIYLISIADLSYVLNMSMRMSPMSAMGMSMGRSMGKMGSASLNVNAKGGSSQSSSVIAKRAFKNMNVDAVASAVCLQCQNIPSSSKSKILTYYTLQIPVVTENHIYSNYVAYKIPHPPKSISL